MSKRVGDVITLPAGTRVGMGRLKTAVKAIIDIVDKNSLGEPMYGVYYYDSTGKKKTTWI